MQLSRSCCSLLLRRDSSTSYLSQLNETETDREMLQLPKFTRRIILNRRIIESGSRSRREGAIRRITISGRYKATVKLLLMAKCNCKGMLRLIDTRVKVHARTVIGDRYIGNEGFRGFESPAKRFNDNSRKSVRVIRERIKKWSLAVIDRRYTRVARRERCATSFGRP